MLSGFRNVSCPIQSQELLICRLFLLGSPSKLLFHMSCINCTEKCNQTSRTLVCLHAGRQYKEGSGEGGQELDTQELQEDREEEEGGMKPLVFGRGMFFPPPGNLRGNMTSQHKEG